MAVRDQGNQENSKIKKKGPQKKRQPAKKKQKRLQPKRQKQRQATKAGSRAVLSISSPRLFAAKILQHLSKVRKETNTRGLMRTLLVKLYDQILKEMKSHISNEVKSLNQNDQPPTDNPSDVQEVLEEATVREPAEDTAEPTSCASETLAA